MEEFKKINEGEVVSATGDYGIRISHNGVSYWERRRTVAFCDAEHTINPYILHLYLGTLTFACADHASEERRSRIIERIKSALTFAGTPFICE
jgi:hypothetical protein